jgi:hypothetical protein
MSISRTRKNKENPHYGFLVSWEPKAENKLHVKRETEIHAGNHLASNTRVKKADSLARVEAKLNVKKDILRSLIIISLILILELVIYLAWNRFITK